MIKLILAHEQDLGDFKVQRALPAAEQAMVGPFIFVDHFGPVDFAPGSGVEVRPHPHVGLATVTYLFEGALMHRDSLGTVQRIDAGDVNWMTAGRGIVHSEGSVPEDRALGHRVHGMQIWVALPDAHEDTDPAFTHVPQAALPRMLSPGIDLRLIAGKGFGRQAPAPTFSPMYCAVCRLARQSRFEIEAESPERAVYVVSGEVVIGGAPVLPHQLAVLVSSKTVYVDAVVPSVLIFLGGEPVGERLISWNFVASSPARIAAARQRWQAQAFPPVPGETEFIPLPP